jgi:hypothetical protein
MNTIPKPEESATPERPTVSEIMFSLWLQKHKC